VILGDPGAGKTTLCKWLALQHARALLQHTPRVQIPANLVHPGAQKNTLLDLGPPRLPILVRIADYAYARWGKDYRDNELPLHDFLGGHENRLSLPSALPPEAIRALIADAITQGQALIILDGLDEVADPDQRKTVMQEVRRHLMPPSPETQPVQSVWTNNHVLLTSRIIGYQFDPLTDLPHYTIEEMDETAITSFCHSWMSHVVVSDDSEAAEQAKQLKEAIFTHAHPGVRVLASNPLLLTLMAQVYWNSPKRILPTTRVDLFAKVFDEFFHQREAYWKRASIPQSRLSHALAAVAAYIHVNEPTGFAEEGDIVHCLRDVLSNDEQVEALLEAAREVSGFLVARGEGVYGFLHRALQEYFVAQHLVNQTEQVIVHLRSQCLNPLWREPIVLAVGLISQPNSPNSRRLLTEAFTALLEAPDPAGDMFPRRTLLAAAACAECERIPPGMGQRIAESLLVYYIQHQRHESLPAIRASIQRAFLILYRSPAANKEIEVVLCAALQSGERDRRSAAVKLVLQTELASSALAEALIHAWTSYADPAGSLLVALDNMYQRHPECFTDTFLPMRRTEFTWLWEQAKESLELQNLLRTLYVLPASNDVIPARVSRDSPLTASIMDLLKHGAGSEDLATLRHYLLSLMDRPGTAHARDAALALSALEDTSWVQVYMQSTSGQDDLHQSVLESLALLPILARDRVDDLRMRPEAREVARTFAFALTIGIDLDQAFTVLSIPENRTLLWRDLDNIPAEMQEIRQDIEVAYRPWENEAKTRYGVSPLTWGQNKRLFLQAIREAWSTMKHAAIRSPAISSPPPEIPITQERLALLIEDLADGDDTRREHARQVLQGRRKASTLGRDIIESLAIQATRHADRPWIINQLDQALQAILHDRADWIHAWIIQANASEERNSAHTILRSIGHTNPEVFNMLVGALSDAAPWVKKALLYTFRRPNLLEPDFQEQYQSLPTRLLEHVLIWWKQETDTVTRDAIVQILVAYWRQRKKFPFVQRRRNPRYWALPVSQLQETSLEVGMMLLDLLHNSPYQQTSATTYMALARLATYQPELVERARVLFLQGIPHSGATAAFVCLSVEEQWRAADGPGKETGEWRAYLEETGPSPRLNSQTISSRLLNRLEEVLFDPTICLAALIDAGVNDDDWDDTYHGVLVSAARMHMERSTERDSGQLGFLVTRLQQAVEHEEWETRRIVLAIVAACLEVMPTALLNAAQDKLEALLVKGAMDETSPDARRFALTSLSYLRVVTPAILPALLTGCLDVMAVRRDTIAAVKRFQSIDRDLLQKLIPFLTDSSESTAYAVANLLGALGMSAAGESSELREQIVHALVKALKEQRRKREVAPDKLEHAMYSALVQATGWTE